MVLKIDELQMQWWRTLKLNYGRFWRRIYHLGSGELSHDGQDMEAWSLRQYQALGPAFTRVGIPILTGAAVSIYLLAPEESRLIDSFTFVSMALAILLGKFRKTRRSAYFVITVVGIIGTAWGCHEYLAAPSDIAKAMAGAGMYAGISTVLILLSRYSNGVTMIFFMIYLTTAWWIPNGHHTLIQQINWLMLHLYLAISSTFLHILAARRQNAYVASALAKEHLEKQNDQLRRTAIVKELSMARQVQEFLDPQMMRMTGRYGEVRCFQTRHEVLGGDWMGIRRLSSGALVIVVADVTGKGIPAAMVAQAIHTLWVRCERATSFDPVSWLYDVNKTLLELGRREPHTATLGLAVLTEDNLSYYSCGHVPLVYGEKVGEQTKFRNLVATGNILGFGADLDLKPMVLSLENRQFESLLLGTDGVFNRESPARLRTMGQFIARLATEGEAVLNDIAVADDKLIIWVDRSGIVQPTREAA